MIGQMGHRSSISDESRSLPPTARPAPSSCCCCGSITPPRYFCWERIHAQLRLCARLERWFPDMNNSRLEAFSDGVIAIIITIMVLGSQSAARRHAERPGASDTDFSELCAELHLCGHLLEQSPSHDARLRRSHGRRPVGHLHFLFWLSLFPVTTDWVGENYRAAAPSALYGVVLLMASISYWILQERIIVSQGAQSLLKKAVGRDGKARSRPSFTCWGSRRHSVPPGWRRDCIYWWR